MKARINYKSKKTIIILAIALILVIAAIAGTVAFIKGNNQAAAAMGGNQFETTETPVEGEGTTTPTNNDNDEQDQQTELPPVMTEDGNNDQTTDGEEQTSNNNGATGTTNGATGTTNGTTGTTNGTTGTTTGTTGTTVPNQDYTQTTTIVTENPWETRNIGWNSLGIASFTAAAKLDINKPDLDVEKTALVDNQISNTTTEAGTITYVIKINNTTNKDVKNIKTIDWVPEGTTLVENSINENGTINENGKITWVSDINAGSSIELKFTVKVDAKSGIISNKAYVNGRETNLVENEIKHSYVVNYVEKGTETKLAESKIVENKTYGDIVTESPIEIEGYKFVETSPEELTISENENNIINIYYEKRADLSYTVNYLEEGTNTPVAESKVVNNQVFKSEVTETAIDVEGYNKVEPTTATITIEVENNIINFYYTKRVDLSYTVNYLEQGTDKVLHEAKVVNDQTFGTSVTENAIEIEGYNKVDPTSATITIAVEGNVINFYYTARTDLSYTVNYLEQGTDKVLAPAKTVDGQTFGTTVTENAIDIEGYNKVDPTSATITIAVENNVINFYYTARTDLSYTVNYLEQGTDKVLAPAKTVDGQTFGKSVTENAIDITGYNKVDPTSATITIAVEGNVINFYYTARTDLSYTVNYLEQGTNKVLHEAKVVGGQTFGKSVTENAIDIEGYNKVDPTSATITIEVEGNVINFYYTKRVDLSYTVNYLEQGTDKVLHEAKVVNDQTFGTQVTENAIDITGYDKVDPTSATITIAVEGNVINFYYTKRADLSYTVNYLEQGTNKVLHEAKVVNDQTFGKSVTENAIDIEGYNKVDPTSATITIAVEGNVINFYYTARTDLSYTVNYLEQGTNKVLHEAKVVNGQTFGKSVTENAIDIEGYNKVDPTSATITIAVEGNVINFYYTKRADLSYTVNYLEKGTTTVIHEAKTVGNQLFGSTITSANEVIEIDGYTYDSVDKETLTIGTGANVINIYYTKRADLSYTVNYLEEGTNEPVEESKVVNNKTYKEVITETAIDVEGYNKVEPTSKTITIELGDNVINFYYTKRADLSYTVNYLEKETDTVLAPAKTVGNQVFGSTITSANEVIKIDGYNYDSVDKETLTIGTGANVINIYYTKRADLSYTVNYLEKGTTTVIHEAKTVGNQLFGSIITSANEVIEIDGYNYDSVDKETLTIGTGANVINIYYTKRVDLSYTVNYLEKGTTTVIHEAKTVGNQVFGSTITSADEVINIDGYNYDSVDKETLTIGTGANVINIYYTKRADLSYTVNYLEQGTNKVLHEAKVVNDQTFGKSVTENAIDIEGYNKVDPTSATITIAVEGNVINFYYTARTDLSYTVNYLEQGTNEVLAPAKTVDGQTFGASVTENAIDITGYNKVDPTSATITIAVEGNVINFYYTKRADLSYTVNYYYNGVKEDSETFTGIEYKTEIGSFEDKPIYNGKTYKQYKVETTSEDKKLPLIIGTGSNVINVYYGITEVTISKNATSTINVDGTIHYTITVKNTGYIPATGVNVVDPLPAELDNITNITNGGKLNGTNVEWNNLTIPANNGSISLEFDAKIKNYAAIGKIISNTAQLGGTETGSSNTVTTKVNDLKVFAQEVKKGETGKDSANIVLVMDLSYSMQEYKVADKSKTRLAAAKEAAAQFVEMLYKDQSDSKATVTVLTFNTKDPVTRENETYIGTKVCDNDSFWHNHWGCKYIDGIWYSEWETKTTTETLPYSGTSKLGEADNSNWENLVDKINAITLPDKNPTGSDGWNANGLGTNVSAALDLTKTTIENLEVNHSNNKNVVIFLSDGKPTSNYSGNSMNSLEKKAETIKNEPADFYSIGFGSEAANPNSDAYELLYKMSSDKHVYTSDSVDTLVENFRNILDDIKNKEITTKEGIFSIVTTKDLVVDAENPITVTYNGETLFTCTSLPNNGMSYDARTKTLKWDINEWNASHDTKVTETEKVLIQYFIEK